MNCTSAEQLKLSGTEALILEALKISRLNSSEILEFLNKRHVLLSKKYLWDLLRELEEKKFVTSNFMETNQAKKLYKSRSPNPNELH